MLQELKKPAGGPDFREGCGDGSFPQTNIEAIYQNYQELFDLVEVR